MRVQGHVHHRTYERWGGDELITDLVTLCSDCHAMLHALLDKRPLVSLENMTRRFLGERIKRTGYHPRFRTYRRKRPPLWEGKENNHE
jgi:5-methylcytosine-specific restriction endonuclease McrA